MGTVLAATYLWYLVSIAVAPIPMTDEALPQWTGVRSTLCPDGPTQPCGFPTLEACDAVRAALTAQLPPQKQKGRYACKYAGP